MIATPCLRKPTCEKFRPCDAKQAATENMSQYGIVVSRFHKYTCEKPILFRDAIVPEFSEDDNEQSKPNAAKRVSRCDAHPKGSMLNPVSFDEISAGSQEIFVEYSNQLYRLSRTRLCKLILTKASNPFGS